MKTYEVKMKTTQLFNDLFKIRIEDESENFDPINNYDDGVKLRMTLASTLFRDLWEDKDGSDSTYQLFDIESVNQVEKKTYEVDIDFGTSVQVRVEAWNESDADIVANELIQSNPEEYVEVYDLEASTDGVREVA